MRTNINFVFVVVLFLLTQQICAQDDETLKYKVEQLEAKKETVAQVERAALKQEVETINKRLQRGKISKEEARELKTVAAEKRAMNIENKVAILENSIALLKRKGSIDLNTDTNNVEIGFGSDDNQGDILFGVKYNSGNQKKKRFTIGVRP